MIRIYVTAAAYAAIVNGRAPECNLLPPQRSPSGEFALWLDKQTLNRLTAARGPRESYSDAIIRLANQSEAA